jgi:hypothetical protein
MIPHSPTPAVRLRDVTDADLPIFCEHPARPGRRPYSDLL